ncbi:MAG: SCO1664 family protein [Actinomycetota bacterium]|nr:SCO1664 family protein [Actinomycetota bacterium]
MITKSEHISSGEIVVIVRLVDASNATLLAKIKGSDPTLQVIYKPIAGERPLWDFPDGNLANREYSAFLLSEFGGFNLVPFTTLRDGPFGLGMVQEWITVDETINVVEFGQSNDQQLRELALFDAVINNTDRKFGHLLVDATGKLKGCDHGVAFHVENKLRTVIWQFSSSPLDDKEIDQLNQVQSLDLEQLLKEYLTTDEISALRQRVRTLLLNGVFPEPSQLWPAIPWPPV